MATKHTLDFFCTLAAAINAEQIQLNSYIHITTSLICMLASRERIYELTELKISIVG